MIVGVLRLSLSIPGARSLKEKRHALRRVIDRLKVHHNVAVAEVGDNDLWQRARIGVVTVSNDHAFVGQMLDKVVRDVEGSDVVELLGREVEIDSYADLYGDLVDKPFVDGSTVQEQADWDVEAEERAIRDQSEARAIRDGAGDERPEPPYGKQESGRRAGHGAQQDPQQDAANRSGHGDAREGQPRSAPEAGWLREEDLS
jgi:uncharacterized protein YlxP (DUF503 family)